MSDERANEKISGEIDDILGDIEANFETPSQEESSQIASETWSAGGIPSSSTAERVLETLVNDARATNSEIAEQTDVSKPTVRKYITQLEEKGVIKGYSVDIDPGKVDRTIAIIAIKIDEAVYEEATKALTEIDAVQSAYSTKSRDTVIIKISVADFHALSSLLSDSIQAIDGVKSTQPSILEKRHV